MHRDETFAFIKRWNDLERAGRELDFARSEWARDLRSKWGNGERGDEEFVKWCEVEIGLAITGAHELLDRALAAKIVPDRKTWDRVGGFQQVRQLVPLAPSDRVSVLEAAKSTHRNVRSVLKERGLVERQERANPFRDAQTLAEYIVSLGIDVPRNVSSVINRYAAGKKRAA